MKQCLIHLGFAKTGTTSVQESLFLNRDYLRANGIYYPSLEMGGQPLGKNACHVFQSVTREYDRINPFWKLGRSARGLRNVGIALLDALIGDFHKTGCSTLLISSELLPGPYLPSFCDILREDVGPPRGVLYLRSPFPRFRSHFQQRLRAGRLLKNCNSLLLRPRIEQLQDCFQSPLMLRAYIEKSEDTNWNAVDDFWPNVLGIAPPPRRLGSSLNEADTAEITVVFAQVGERLDHWKRDERQIFFGWCRNKIRDMNLSGFECMRFEFSKDIERMVIAATDSDNRWLEETHGLRWAGIGRREQMEVKDEIIRSAEHLRLEVKHSPRTCAAIARYLLQHIRNGVPRGVDASTAAEAVASAVEVFSSRQAP